MKALTLDGTEALSTFNRHIPTGEVNRIKEASDAKDEGDDLTISSRNVNKVKSKAWMRCDDIAESRRNKDELKEVWEH